jgi:putative transposase
MSKSKASKKSSTFIRKTRKEHGGSLAVGKRRRTRPLNLKLSHHITLKSHHAIGSRSLFRYKRLLLSLIKKNSLRFKIKVYEYSIQGNHIHLLLKAQSREGLQNFFRVFAGHSAQQILKSCPLKAATGSAANKVTGTRAGLGGCKKNRRQFWSYLLYSRVVSWGREFRTVVAYIQKNTLELLQIVAYAPRSTKNSS